MTKVSPCDVQFGNMKEEIEEYKREKEKFDVELRTLLEEYNSSEYIMKNMRKHSGILFINKMPLEIPSIREKWQTLNSTAFDLDRKAREILNRLAELREMGCELQPLKEEIEARKNE